VVFVVNKRHTVVHGHQGNTRLGDALVPRARALLVGSFVASSPSPSYLGSWPIRVTIPIAGSMIKRCTDCLDVRVKDNPAEGRDYLLHTHVTGPRVIRRLDRLVAALGFACREVDVSRSSDAQIL